MNNKWSVASKVRKGITFGKAKVTFKDAFVFILMLFICISIYKLFTQPQFGLAILCMIAVISLFSYLLLRPHDNPELRNYDLFLIWNFDSKHRNQKKHYKKFEMKDLEK